MTETQNRVNRVIVQLTIAAVVVGGLVVAMSMGRQQLASYIPAFAGWVESLGIWGPIVFILGYAVAAVALVPGSLLTLAAGALFGLAEGTLYVAIGSSLGACLAFLLGRYTARPYVERMIEGNKKFAAVDRAVGKNGFKIVFLLRLSPAFPFSFLNYALGLTKVRFLDYALACIGMLPGTFLYVFYGYTAGSLATAVSGVGGQKGVEGWVFLGVGLLATVIVTIFVTRIARRALKESTDVADAEAVAE